MTPRRPGYTLIEMIAVMVCTATVIVLCVTTLAALTKSERGGRTAATELAGLDRLASRFRDDVHAAIAPPEPANPAGLILRLPGGEAVEYRVADDALIVERGTGDAKRSERFQFRGWKARSVGIVAEPGGAIARLNWRSSLRESGDDVVIEAVAIASTAGEAP